MSFVIRDLDCSLESLTRQRDTRHSSDSDRRPSHSYWTGATVRICNKFYHRFSTTSGVQQGCVLALALFLVAIDWILGHLADIGITVGNYHFTDLDYADDAAILMYNQLQANSVLQSLMPLLLHWA